MSLNKKAKPEKIVTKSVRITKAEYYDDSDDWEDKLIAKYGLDASSIVDSQRNYDGKRYTYDVWMKPKKGEQAWTVKNGWGSHGKLYGVTVTSGIAHNVEQLMPPHDGTVDYAAD